MLQDDTNPLEAEFNSRVNIHCCLDRAPKSVGVSITILLCQLLLVFLINEGEARHVFKSLKERKK